MRLRTSAGVKLRFLIVKDHDFLDNLADIYTPNLCNKDLYGLNQKLPCRVNLYHIILTGITNLRRNKLDYLGAWSPTQPKTTMSTQYHPNPTQAIVTALILFVSNRKN